MSAELQHLHRSWTRADLETLPDDGYRYEVIDGQLVVSPPPGAGHQLLADALCRLLVAGGWHAITACGLQVPPELDREENYVIPDVLVARAAFGLDKEHFTPAEITCVVEVVSPGSRRRDRSTKRSLYAELGIATYVVIEPAQRRLVRLALEGGVLQGGALDGGDYLERGADLHGITWADLVLPAHPRPAPE